MHDSEAQISLLDGESKKNNRYMNVFLCLAFIACGVGVVYFLNPTMFAGDSSLAKVETPIGISAIPVQPTGEAAVAMAKELYDLDYSANPAAAEAKLARKAAAELKIGQLKKLEETRVGRRRKGTPKSRKMCRGRKRGTFEECVEAYQEGVEEFMAVAWNEDNDYCMKPNGKQKSPWAINCCGKAQCWFSAGLGCFNHCRFWSIWDSPSFKYMANCCGHQQAPEGCYDWNSCPGGKHGGWHTCNGGSYCIKGGTWACAGKIVEGITTIIDAGLSIALLCASGGTSAAVRSSAKAATKAATKAGRAWDAAKALAKGAKAMARNFKRNVKDHFKDKGLREEVTEAIAESAAEQMLAAELDLGSLAWDIAEVVDPTGITSVVRFYSDVDECNYPEEMMSSTSKAILQSGFSTVDVEDEVDVGQEPDDDGMEIMVEGDECMGSDSNKVCVNGLECLSVETGAAMGQCAMGECKCIKTGAVVQDECLGNDLNLSTKICEENLTCVKGGMPMDVCKAGECKCERVVGAGEVCMGNGADAESTCMGNMECTNPKTGAVEDMCEQGKCECISKAQLGEDCTADLKDIGDSLNVMVCDSGLQCLDATGMACSGSSVDVGCTCEMMSDGDDESALAQRANRRRYTCDEMFDMCKTRRCANNRWYCLARCQYTKRICECRRPVIDKRQNVCKPMSRGRERQMCYKDVHTQYRNCRYNRYNKPTNSNEVDVGAADDLELKLNA